MITDRNKLNFVTIQWLLWFYGLILVCSGSDSNSNTLIHNVETTQQQLQQLQQQHNQPALSLAQAQAQAQQSTLQQPSQQQVESNGPPPQQDVTVRNFSPRMDYNNHEWRPVGRGDPLKNDPTFDYSPPTLDRVRYWADPEKDKEKTEEVSSAIIDAKLKKANPGKNEILLLGVAGDRLRGAPVLQHAAAHSPSMMKNAKGETPLLQPKYTSIRRSYYAHQLPTHLMPPPMQPMMPASQQQQQQQPQSQQQQQPIHQQMVVQHMIKPVHMEYRHNMPGGGMSPNSFITSSPMATSMNVHTKPQHMSLSTHQPWMHTSSSMSTSMPSQRLKPAAMGQYFSHHPHDSHHQESMNYMSYTRPNMMSSTPAVMGGNQEYYSPNSIRGSVSVHKPATSSRKPWLHDLLKKEFIKPQKPTVNPKSYHAEAPKPPQMETNYHNSYHIEASQPPRMETNYHNSYHTEAPKPPQIETSYHSSYQMETSKPQHMENTYYNLYHTEASKSPQMESHFANSYHKDATKSPQIESHFEPMISPPRGISTTYAPVTFVTPPTTSATTQSAVYITSSSTTSAPVFTHAPSTYAPTRTTTTLSPTRLLIPNTSNLAYRPTVTPMKMTTDSLFSHYNQPEKPLKGPMYLIIEGHSKVKTYGKDELDPHRPKIVPVISKREPVVRVADPNEKRGTPETFQVKHLHTKTTSAMDKPTTPKPTIKLTPSSTTTTTKKPVVTNTTTNKPNTKDKTTTLKPTKPAKPATKKQQPDMATTSAKPITTTKHVPKLSVTTSTTTTAKPKTLNKDSKTPMKGDKMSPSNLNIIDTAAKPSQPFLTQPPTGMQGLLSLLGSSLDTFLHDGLTVPASSPSDTENKDTTTKLKPVNMNLQNDIEARVSTKLQAIKAEDYDDDEGDDQLRKATTEYLPRETRQVFDYDQLPESRISEDKDNSNYEDLIDNLDDEEDLSALGFDDEYEEEDDEPSPSNHQQLIKRIDSLVSSSEDLDDDADLAELEDEDDLDALSLVRQQKSSPKKA